MIRRICNSIKARIDSLKNTIKSGYWEYAEYYSDGQIWDQCVLFEAYSGSSFQGNPYYVYKCMFHNLNCAEYQFYIVWNAPQTAEAFLKKHDLWDERVEVIVKDSAKYRKVLAHAKFLVNNVSFSMDFIKKEGQVYLNTWHGTPLKSLGRRIKNDPFELENSQRNMLLCDYLLAPNEFLKRVYCDDYMIARMAQGKIIDTGYPRNSIFFDVEQRIQVKKKFNLEGVMSVLYMPTWRGKANGSVRQLNEAECLARDLGEHYKIYVKLHPAVLASAQNMEFCYCHEIPDDMEVYEFLNGIDILVTDYSSVLFDFANTGKRIVLYQYDKEEYFSARGIYEEIDKSIALPIARTYDELVKIIGEDRIYDIKEFQKKFNTYDCAEASDMAAELLLGDKREAVPSPMIDLYIIDFPISNQEILDIKNNFTDPDSMFAFICKRKTKGFKNIDCFDQLTYIRLYMDDRLLLKEKITVWAAHIMFCITGKERYNNICRDYMMREQRRLFGNLRIGNVYAKSRRLPLCIKYCTRKTVM